MSYLTSITLFILKGSILTLQIYAVTMIFSIPLGLVCAMGKISKIKFLRFLLGIYTTIVRGTPLLLQLYFTYFGLSVVGINLSPFIAAAITFIINYAAYYTEIFRGGLQSIDKGQFEAAKTLGMDYKQTMKRIIIPQTFARVLPPISNEAINLVKDTALVTVIGMPEILKAAKEILNRDFVITPFVIAAAIYLCLTFVIVYIFRKLEEKYVKYI
ncbi:amino acid ABC transporter permease [Clostridium sediminicola]|uniref:amino acid ABC transporter permease n=1 Tax=Clostridium sediminicola TaxID=3114879 RepID=UPI0031F276AA